MFNDLLNELKGFKYQITVEVLLKNTSLMEKLNLDQFILIQKQKQQQITCLNKKNLLTKFYT